MDPNQEQHNAPEAGAAATEHAPAARTAGESDNAATAAFSKLENLSGWSWGGFMFGPAYLIGTKHYAYLLLYLLTLVPLLGGLVWLGIAIFLGLKGHDLVAQSRMFKNDDERNGFNRAIDHAGLITFLFTVAIFLLVFLFFGAMIGGIMSDLGSMPMDPSFQQGF